MRAKCFKQFFRYREQMILTYNGKIIKQALTKGFIVIVEFEL